MLPKERRLRKRADIENVFSNGRRLERPWIRVVWTGGKGRAVVVVSKSVGSIAYRNTLRRRWREALGESVEFIPNESDLVVVVKSRGAKERGENIYRELNQAFERLQK